MYELKNMRIKLCKQAFIQKIFQSSKWKKWDTFNPLLFLQEKYIFLQPPFKEAILEDQ